MAGVSIRIDGRDAALATLGGPCCAGRAGNGQNEIAEGAGAADRVDQQRERRARGLGRENRVGHDADNGKA